MLLLGHEPVRGVVAPVLLFAAAFQLHALYSIDYTFEGSELRIRASLFRWRVPLAQIDSIEPSSNPLSSPAGSLDRLLIRYGEKRILISPEDEAGFLRALAQRVPGLEVVGDRVRRRGDGDAGTEFRFEDSRDSPHGANLNMLESKLRPPRSSGR